MIQRPQRIYLVFFLLLFMGTAALIAFLLGTAYVEKQHQAEVNARNVVAVLEARLEAALRRTQANLEELAQRTPLAALSLAARPQYAATMQQQLALPARHFPEIVGLRLIDAEGNVLYASDRLLPQANVRDRSYFIALSQHPQQPLFFSEVTTGRINRILQLYMAVPIRTPQGAFAGIAMAPLDIGYFQQLFDAVDLGPHGVITFRRSDDGRLVLRHPARPGTVNQTLHNNPMQQRVEAGEQQGVIRFHAAIDHVERVYAFKRVGEFPFYVAAGIASDDFLAQWHTTLLGTVVVSLLCLLLLAWLLQRLRRSEERRLHASGELQASEDRFLQLFNSVGEGICGMDGQGRYLFSNPAARQLLGHADEATLREQDLPGLIHARQADGRPLPATDCLIRQAVRQGQSVHEADDVFTRADGSLLAVRYDAYPLLKDGKNVGTVLLFQDIGERKRQQQQIAFLAHHDALTGLPNRILAEDRFCQLAGLAQRHEERLAMLFLDLDGFKTINDSLGHDVGDEMLQAVAQRLQSLLREHDTACRLGGDEFLLLLPGIRGMGGVEGLALLIGRLLHGLEQPFLLQNHQLSTSASIGVALYPDDGEDFTTLMKKADTAMYHAKDAGRNTYRLFDERMNVEAQQVLRLRSHFMAALEAGQFVLHYQPQVRLADGQVLGVEALVRWQDGERLIAPAEFIPMAESSGLIVPLGEWVLHEACRQAVQWQQEHDSPLCVAVNISAVQFKRGNLEHTVAEALAHSGLPPQLLELELTETTLLHQTEAVLHTLSRLSELGVRLAIDDFGTGYSSLAYLKRLSVNKLKIDQSFIRHLTEDADDGNIVCAIIEMARKMQLQTLAEGVESQQIADLLRQMGCEQAQGYHFARPLTAAQLHADLLAQRAGRPS
ncbi:bifunctional diguanylate cyclase/phosphodiesterase [Aquitalea aquatilis]|uniref:bifunctional diguanylate cyclase/phosphodiesterase n=1 Tax=Aquitalea aquatilis TaxID=1537400 RepID=UPI0010BD09D4|nr:EAL domain-containing protein [Aquitalea aquatilis]